MPVLSLPAYPYHNTRQLRNAWTEAKELDSAMTDLARVNAEISRDGFPDYLDRVINKTNQLALPQKITYRQLLPLSVLTEMLLAVI